jgi:hypothetical protein
VGGQFQCIESPQNEASKTTVNVWYRYNGLWVFVSVSPRSFTDISPYSERHTYPYLHISYPISHIPSSFVPSPEKGGSNHKGTVPCPHGTDKSTQSTLFNFLHSPLLPFPFFLLLIHSSSSSSPLPPFTAIFVSYLSLGIDPSVLDLWAVGSTSINRVG